MISADDFVEVSPAFAQEMRRVQRVTEPERRARSVANGHAVAQARAEIEERARERGRAEAFQLLREKLRDLDVEVDGSAMLPRVVNHRPDHPGMITPACRLFRLRNATVRLPHRPLTRYERFLTARADEISARHGHESEPHILALVHYHEVRAMLAHRKDAK